VRGGIRLRRGFRGNFDIEKEREFYKRFIEEAPQPKSSNDNFVLSSSNEK